MTTGVRQSSPRPQLAMSARKTRRHSTLNTNIWGHSLLSLIPPHASNVDRTNPVWYVENVRYPDRADGELVLSGQSQGIALLTEL